MADKPRQPAVPGGLSLSDNPGLDLQRLTTERLSQPVTPAPETETENPHSHIPPNVGMLERGEVPPNPQTLERTGERGDVGTAKRGNKQPPKRGGAESYVSEIVAAAKPATDEGRLSRLSVDLDEELLDWLKVFCAKHKVKQRQIVHVLLTEFREKAGE